MFSWIKKGLIASLMMVGLAVPAYASERSNIIKLIEKVSSSVGALYAQEEGGNIRYLCTATAVDREKDKTVILSANHCLEKGVSYLINFGDNRLRSLTAWKAPHYEVDDKKYPRKYNEPKTDMALFLMDGMDVPVVPLAKLSAIKPGSQIIMVGFPLGVTKLTYEGIVAGRFNRIGTDQYNYHMLQIFGAPGSSGSSVINVDTGEVIAVLVSAKQSQSGLPVIFATPIEYKENLIPILNE